MGGAFPWDTKTACDFANKEDLESLDQLRRSSCLSPFSRDDTDDDEEEGEGKTGNARFYSYDDFLQATRPRRHMPRIRRACWPLVLLVLLCACVILGRRAYHADSNSDAQLVRWIARLQGPAPVVLTGLGNEEVFEKPTDIKIVALVFFGRRIFVDILDCYLRANLAVNNGFLDEVHFIVHTEDQTDIAWLEDLVATDRMEPYYKVMHDDQDLDGGSVWGTFPNLYGKYATDEDTLYVKIDDDMVWLDDNAIPHLVSALLAHPEAHSVQANVINSQWSQYFHHGTGAILPYLPEPQSMRSLKREPPSWRASKLPDYPLSELSAEGQQPFLDPDFQPRFPDHRWLPLPHTAANLMRTPWGIGDTLPNPKDSTKGRISWQVAAQEHFSLFDHIEHDNLGVYSWGRDTDGLWNPWYQHYNINFMAFFGKTMKQRPFWGSPNDPHFIRNDEVALTQIVPKELAMPVLVDTRALVSHYAFHMDGQRENLRMTDILSRYRALANERVCSVRNQKKPLDQTRYGSGYENHMTGMKSKGRKPSVLPGPKGPRTWRSGVPA